MMNQVNVILSISMFSLTLREHIMFESDSSNCIVDHHEIHYNAVSLCVLLPYTKTMLIPIRSFDCP